MDDTETAADNNKTVATVNKDKGKAVATVMKTMGGPGPATAAALASTLASTLTSGKVNSDGDSNDHDSSQRIFKLPAAAQKGQLLTVAPEIRNMIFKLCLSHPEGIFDILKKGCRGHENWKAGLTMFPYYPDGEARPKIKEAFGFANAGHKKTIQIHSTRNMALMRTCQAVYMEAVEVLWGQKFEFNSLIHFQTFLLSNARLDLVRHVKIWSLDYNVGINWMPAVCAQLVTKFKALETLDVDMSYIHKNRVKRAVDRHGVFGNNEELKKSGKNLGFDIYSCMYPWVTQVVRDQGPDKLMQILVVPTEGAEAGDSKYGSPRKTRVYREFEGAGALTPGQWAIVAEAATKEMVRQVGLYEGQ